MAAARRRSDKPQGQTTRGKTARNRLRRLDHLLSAYDAPLLRRRDGPWRDAVWVDLGYGAEPYTTLETADRWCRVAPHLRGLGVEIDAQRVARAEPFADHRVSFRQGGFNMPLRPSEPVRLIRAFNVLRQYSVEAVDEALAEMSVGVLPGGLLVEGTSDPPGRAWVANLYRRLELEPSSVAWRREALVFSISFRSGLDPVQLQAVLPKDLIHEMVPGTRIFAFFEHWKTALRDSRAWSDWGLRQWFGEAARRLASHGYDLDLRRRYLRRGYLIWRRPEVDDRRQATGSDNADTTLSSID